MSHDLGNIPNALKTTFIKTTISTRTKTLMFAIAVIKTKIAACVGNVLHVLYICKAIVPLQTFSIQTFSSHSSI